MVINDYAVWWEGEKMAGFLAECDNVIMEYRKHHCRNCI
jgi:hypothetical protein